MAYLLEDPSDPDQALSRRHAEAMRLPKKERKRELARIAAAVEYEAEQRRDERRNRIVGWIVIPAVVIGLFFAWAGTNAFGTGGTSEPQFDPDNPPTCVWHTGMGAC